jgi:hypothetical protein
MFKKIFINFLMLFVLASSSWAGIYRGKLIADFEANNLVTSDDFNFVTLQNDLGLDIEMYPPYITNRTINGTNSAYFHVAILIKNPDFTFTDKIISKYCIRKLNGKSYFFDDRNTTYVERWFTTKDLTCELDTTWEWWDEIKQRASKVFYFTTTHCARNSDKFEVYFNILDSNSPSNYQPGSNLAYIEAENGINLRIEQEDISIFENRDTDDFNYSFIKCSDKPERLNNGNIKCYANQIRKAKIEKPSMWDKPNKIKEKFANNKMVKLIEKISGFRTDRVYIIYDPIAEEIVERSQNLYLE